MSQMMVWSINLLVLSVCILIAGMIKPKWILFWMSKPSRVHIQLLAVALFMGGAVMFGEAGKAKQQEQQVIKAEMNKAIAETPAIPTEIKK